MDPCKQYLRMLLYTGFHDRTNPDIFKKDLNKIDVSCPEPLTAKHTKSLVSTKDFSSYRYRDLQKLLATIAADIITIDPHDYCFEF